MIQEVSLTLSILNILKVKVYMTMEGTKILHLRTPVH